MYAEGRPAELLRPDHPVRALDQPVHLDRPVLDGSGHNDNLDRLAVSAVLRDSWGADVVDVLGHHGRRATRDARVPRLPGPGPRHELRLLLERRRRRCCSVNQSVIARIGLDNLQNGLNLAAGPHAWRYLDQVVLGGQVTQNTLGRAFWARNIDNSHIQINSWSESSTSYLSPAAVVAIGSWPNTDYTTTTPDGKNWLATYTAPSSGKPGVGRRTTACGSRGRPAGGRKLGWLSQVHIELVEIDASTLGLVGQRAI